MNTAFSIELINNAALLITLGLVYDISYRQEANRNNSIVQTFFGLGIGLISIVLMATPAILAPGIIFDTRTILLCLTGLYFGPVTTIIAVLIAAGYRYNIGGVGTIAGIATILTSGTIGILWNRYRDQEQRIYSLKELYVFGLTVHIVMLMCMFLLPTEAIQKTIQVLVIPAIVIYPIGTSLLGSLLCSRKKRIQADKKLEAVTKHERELADIVRNAPIAVAYGYPDGTLANCNATFAELTGYSIEELQAINWNDVLTPEKWRSLEKEKLSQLSLENQSIQYEKEYIHKNGRTIPIELTVTGRFDSSGAIVNFIGFILDITKRKKTEQALIGHQLKYETIISNQKDAVFLQKILPEGLATFSEVNIAAVERYGFSKEEFSQLHPSKILTPEALDEYLNSGVRKKLLKQGYLTFESVHIDKFGTSFPVELSSTVLDLNEEQYILSTIRDITERKLTEKNILKANREWRLIMDEFSDVIYLLDNDRHLLRANSAFYTAMKTTPVHAVGRHIVDLMHPQGEDEPCPVCLAQEEKYNCVVVMEADDENNPTEMPIEIKINILRDESGASTGILVNQHDLTHSRKNEEQQLEFELQLAQKHKMEAVGYMAGGMAHNFNNNLSIILGNVELSQMKQAPDSDAIPLLENAKIAVRRSRDLVRKIVTYSRQGVQNKVSMQLTTIIDETLALLNSTLPSTITLHKNFSSSRDTRLVNADPSQVQEVLINLCNNAVHAMDEKGTLKISLEPVDLEQKDIPAQYDYPPGHYAKLSVQDNGCGMAAEVLDKIFDPFYSTKEEYEGAGMGLSTVQGIVVQHRGIIKVNSTLGQGTTFDLYFPFIESTDNVKPEEESTALLRGTEHILFVDDDEMLATLGERLLSGIGYQVSMMNDSTEALKMFTANADRFDLVITDQTMPGLTGKDLIAEIKKVRADTPTILCTGYSSKVNEENAKELGISAFMMKPLDLPVLSQTIRRVLDGEKEN